MWSFAEDLDLQRFRCHLNRNEVSSRMFGSKVLLCCRGGAVPPQPGLATAAAGAPLLGSLCPGGQSPPTKFHTTGPRRTSGGGVLGRALGFLTADGAQSVFCVLKFKNRRGNKEDTAYRSNITCQEVNEGMLGTIFPVQNTEDIKSCCCVLLEVLLDDGAGTGPFSASVLTYLHQDSGSPRCCCLAVDQLSRGAERCAGLRRTRRCWAGVLEPALRRQKGRCGLGWNSRGPTAAPPRAEDVPDPWAGLRCKGGVWNWCGELLPPSGQLETKWD